MLDEKVPARNRLRYWRQDRNPIAMQPSSRPARLALSPTTRQNVIGALATLVHKALRAATRTTSR
jgi:hypothetical protein